MSTYVPAKYRILRAFANSDKAMAEAACAHIQKNLTLCRDHQTKLISCTDQDIKNVECRTLHPGAELFLVIDHTASRYVRTISEDVPNAISDFIAGWEAAKANSMEK